jgi:hypothetical protein
MNILNKRIITGHHYYLNLESYTGYCLNRTWKQDLQWRNKQRKLCLDFGWNQV